MHAQQATREAEVQQVQLAEMLRQALPQLGIDISPLMHAQSPLLPAPGAWLLGRGRMQLGRVAVAPSTIPTAQGLGMVAEAFFPLLDGPQVARATTP
jgi:hypothetical protein